MHAFRVVVLCSVLGTLGCGSGGSGSGVAAGGTGGTGASSGTGGSGGGSAGSGGSGALGGTAGAATGGAGGTGAVGQWTATPEWTSLPLPLQFGPVLAAHPTNAQRFSVLASSFSVAGTTVIAATTPDRGTTFPTQADLSALPQTAMGEPKGIAYSPIDAQELSAIIWVQGPENDPLSGAHAYRSTDGGQSFAETHIDETLPLNALAFSSLRYTKEGTLAIRVGASVVYTDTGATVADTVSTEDCSAQPGNAAFDVNPDDGKQVAVPCGESVAICTKSGCTKKSVGYTVADVRYGATGQRLAVIGRKGDIVAVLASQDGGNGFGPVQEFSDNVSPSWRVDWDPRPNTNTVYALLVDHVFRSTDGGLAWEDITPPPELNYVYDFTLAADGTVIARGVFHYLLLSPS